MGLVLVALLIAAPVIAALIPAVVQFCPQTCKHWENDTWQLAGQACWLWAVVTEAKSIIAAVISFICPLQAGVTTSLSITKHRKRANEIQKTRRACKAMLALKHRSRERGPLKPGEMQVGTPEWMKNRPEYKHVIA